MCSLLYERLNIGSNIWLERCNLEAKVTICGYNGAPPTVMLLLLMMLMMLMMLTAL